MFVLERRRPWPRLPSAPPSEQPQAACCTGPWPPRVPSWQPAASARPPSSGWRPPLGASRLPASPPTSPAPAALTAPAHLPPSPCKARSRRSRARWPSRPRRRSSTETWPGIGAHPSGSPCRNFRRSNSQGTRGSKWCTPQPATSPADSAPRWSRRRGRRRHQAAGLQQRPPGPMARHKDRIEQQPSQEPNMQPRPQARRR
mmetsp:Transcript_108212/g.312753  ORF Transcript_108212/g.312753 Transcript_108212/m.312753 type:complete len:201 (-) Transcript_108212:153-755(-)